MTQILLRGPGNATGEGDNGSREKTDWQHFLDVVTNSELGVEFAAATGLVFDEGGAHEPETVAAHDMLTFHAMARTGVKIAGGRNNVRPQQAGFEVMVDDTQHLTAVPEADLGDTKNCRRHKFRTLTASSLLR